MTSKQKLTIAHLKTSAKIFCEMMSGQNHKELVGVTDGKAVGTYVEHKFQAFLADSYEVTIGSTAKGIDLPDEDILTDIKVTSIRQPQSSCPYKSASEKIYGLGYNLLVFVYDKIDKANSCHLKFLYCTFIDSNRTADYTTTRRLREMVDDKANVEDIVAYLNDIKIPGDEITHTALAERILQKIPAQGYLTISNALQWRLQYSRVIELNNSVDGITNYVWKT